MRAQARGHINTTTSQQRIYSNNRVVHHQVPPEKSDNQMPHMHLSMQQTMRNNNVGTTSKDTKGELKAGQDLPQGRIKNLP